MGVPGRKPGGRGRAWPPRRPAAARAAGSAGAGPADAGFTLVEVVVAIALIATVMASIGTFYLSSMKATAAQSARQVAIQLANDAMERVRAYDPSSVADQLPTNPQPVTVNGISYRQGFHLTECWQASPGADCGGSTPGAVRFLRVTVEVTWPERTCAPADCAYRATTLVNPNGKAPIFNTRPPPVVENPGDQTWTRGVPLSPPLTLVVGGGADALTFTVTGTPPGLTFDTDERRFEGTPTQDREQPYTVTVTVSDRLSRSATVTFKWTIAAELSVADPGPQETAVGERVELALSHTGGAGPLEWRADGLPDGLSIDAATGVVAGTPTRAGEYRVTVAAVDRAGADDEVRFTWKVGDDRATPGPGTQAEEDGDD